MKIFVKLWKILPVLKSELEMAILVMNNEGKLDVFAATWMYTLSPDIDIKASKGSS